MLKLLVTDTNGSKIPNNSTEENGCGNGGGKFGDAVVGTNNDDQEHEDFITSKSNFPFHYLVSGIFFLF